MTGISQSRVVLLDHLVIKGLMNGNARVENQHRNSISPAPKESGYNDSHANNQLILDPNYFTVVARSINSSRIITSAGSAF